MTNGLNGNGTFKYVSVRQKAQFYSEWVINLLNHNYIWIDTIFFLQRPGDTDTESTAFG